MFRHISGAAVRFGAAGLLLGAGVAFAAPVTQVTSAAQSAKPLLSFRTDTKVRKLTNFYQPSYISNGCGLFSYDLKEMHYTRAPDAMIRVVADTDEVLTLYNHAGDVLRSYKLSPDQLSFWVYARYRDYDRGHLCSFAIVNGFAPVDDSRADASGRYPFVPSEGTNAVIEDCGGGYGMVNLEGYDSIFNPPESRDNPLPLPLSAVQGLAKSCVATAIQAAGGKKALEDWMAAKIRWGVAPDSFSKGLPPVLKAAYAAQGVHLPGVAPVKQK